MKREKEKGSRMREAEVDGTGWLRPPAGSEPFRQGRALTFRVEPL